MVAEVNMLIGFGSIGIIVKNMEKFIFFFFDGLIFPSSLGCLASSFRVLQIKADFILL